MLHDVTFIDLFAGIGGFRVALESLGMKCVFSSEIDKNAAEIYNINFNEHPEGDITQIKETNIPAHDILCAGFPCQPFSIAGKRKGFIDNRGTLFFNIIRILVECQPPVFILENVRNLISLDGGKTFNTIITSLEEVGYTVFHAILNASNFGVASSRTRVYIVGFRNNLLINDFVFPKGSQQIVTINDYLESSVSDSFTVKKPYICSNSINVVPSNKPIRIGYINKGRQGERVYSPQGHAITFSASGGGPGSTSGLYFINDVVRRLTPRECYNIMGFPKSFNIASNTRHAYRQIGNSIAIPVVKSIMQKIILRICRRAMNDIG